MPCQGSPQVPDGTQPVALDGVVFNDEQSRPAGRCDGSHRPTKLADEGLLSHIVE